MLKLVKLVELVERVRNSSDHNETQNVMFLYTILVTDREALTIN